MGFFISKVNELDFYFFGNEAYNANWRLFGIVPSTTNYPKCARLGLALLTPIAAVGDLFPGIMFAAGSIIPCLTMNTKFNAYASINLDSSRYIFSDFYRNILLCINPKSKHEKVTGILAYPIQGRIQKLISNCQKSGYFLNRQVGARLAYVVMAIGVVFGRTIEALIAIPVVPLSILLGGKIERLNTISYQCLQAPLLIGDLYECSLRVLNPYAQRTC